MYFDPSELFLIPTFAIPSNGAATTPSVSIASPVLNPWSTSSSLFARALSPVSSISCDAISAVIWNATSSRVSNSFSNSFNLLATPSGPTNPSTLSAKSFANGTSTNVSASKPLERASFAISYSSFVSFSNL